VKDVWREKERERVVARSHESDVCVVYSVAFLISASIGEIVDE
jgi:hypothetical protein